MPKSPARKPAAPPKGPSRPVSAKRAAVQAEPAPAPRAARTRLGQVLREPTPRRATPLDLFRAARRGWIAGERLDIGALAAELGIGRATAFRWVGSREQLLGEVVWSLCEPLLQQAAAATSGRGPRRVAAICEYAIRAMLVYPPLRRFIEQDAEFALRLLTSKQGPVQERVIGQVRELLRHQADQGALVLPLNVDTLSYLIVRLCESFLYADVISGQRVDAAEAGLAIELLLSGKVESRAKTSPREPDKASSPRRRGGGGNSRT
ncbi:MULTISPECIES: QsdR family transcriptional regulator [unclassified Lysobacter]|uniref:QsdR family transcriptional regulator n=1 Tax=unclassified Lysobacter TaxID=2635362 RepID=UPI001BE69B60|nr:MULTISPECIES: QsdR family transcriptional regulator [unclassified Lysobacter]MBT2745541.1 transcriptional regulator [Lysobacter sp. ISL-42]MBT2753480.1 transcriptional regulator [Lysobacter sp. ISL-50]MBT2777136.1 transcriptional regulator [Lysobacter sp. ISL-54]MBT2780238.1 transcriptional regulator [Lysobacter sp. ISL-52]